MIIINCGGVIWVVNFCKLTQPGIEHMLFESLYCFMQLTAQHCQQGACWASSSYLCGAVVHFASLG